MTLMLLRKPLLAVLQLHLNPFLEYGHVQDAEPRRHVLGYYSLSNSANMFPV